MVASTLIPTWNWRSLGKTNYSEKHKRAGFNHEDICPLDGKLVAITVAGVAQWSQAAGEFLWAGVFGGAGAGVLVVGHPL